MIYIAVLPLIFIISFVSYFFLGGPKLPPETDAIIDEVMENELPGLLLVRQVL